MTASRRIFPASPLRLFAIVLAASLMACTSTASPSASRTATTPARSAAPSLTPVPGGPSPTPRLTLPTTTETEFGTIFDALPPSFPRLPGQEPADTGDGAVSGSFAVNTTVAAASAEMRRALLADDWKVDVGDPLEDGSVVLEATHAPAGCRTEVRFTPLSGTVIMSVLYGASCPFG